MTVSKHQFESALSDLLRELERCPPWLQVEMIIALMAEMDCSSDAAIRELAEFEVITRRLLEASQSMGEA